MGRDLGDGRDQRDGGRAAADDHDPLAGEVEAIGPVLRMHHQAGEVLAARPGRLVALVVSVVARAQVEEAARPGGPRAGLGVLDRHGPPGLLAGPVRAEHPRVVADLPVDAVGGRRFPEVAENIRAACDRLGVLPRAERVTEGEHVRVRPDAGEPEQVPCPAAGATRLDDRVRDAGGIGLQAAGGADTGQAGPHNQDVYMARSRAHRAPCHSHHRPFRIIRFLPNEHGCLDPRIPGPLLGWGRARGTACRGRGPAGANPVERHVGVRADDGRVRRHPQRGLPARRPGVRRGGLRRRVHRVQLPRHLAAGRAGAVRDPGLGAGARVFRAARAGHGPGQAHGRRPDDRRVR